MDAELAAFEAARADRAKRTDYEGHALTTNEKGAVIVAPESKHAERTEHKGTAADMARAYVAKNRERLEKLYGSFGIPRLVQLVDSARDRGDDETRIEIEAWLMSEFAPQVIGIDVHKVVQG